MQDRATPPRVRRTRRSHETMFLRSAALVPFALDRMGKGAYRRVCVSCGGEIPFQRLYAFRRRNSAPPAKDRSEPHPLRVGPHGSAAGSFPQPSWPAPIPSRRGSWGPRRRRPPAFGRSRRESSGSPPRGRAKGARPYPASVAQPQLLHNHGQDQSEEEEAQDSRGDGPPVPGLRILSPDGGRG
jgi:hypothetical protein